MYKYTYSTFIEGLFTKIGTKVVIICIYMIYLILF